MEQIYDLDIKIAFVVFDLNETYLFIFLQSSLIAQLNRFVD